MANAGRSDEQSEEITVVELIEWLHRNEDSFRQKIESGMTDLGKAVWGGHDAWRDRLVSDFRENTAKANQLCELRWQLEAKHQELKREKANVTP